MLEKNKIISSLPQRPPHGRHDPPQNLLTPPTPLPPPTNNCQQIKFWKDENDFGQPFRPKLSLTQHQVATATGHWNRRWSTVSSCPQNLHTWALSQFLLSRWIVWILSCHAIHKNICTLSGILAFQISIIWTSVTPAYVMNLYMVLVVNFPECSSFQHTLSSTSVRITTSSFALRSLHSSVSAPPPQKNHLL